MKDAGVTCRPPKLSVSSCLRALRVNRLEAKPSPRAQVPRTRRSASLPWGAVRTPRAEDGAGTAHATCHSEAKSHNSHSLMRFHCVIKSLHRIYAITHEEAETKSNYSSYKKMDLIHQPLNGMRDFTSERFRREIAHVQEDVARMRERRRDMTETCGAYTSPASFRVARRAFPHVLWFWTGMGSRDFASERFRWEGYNLLR